ncbi:MAG: hypothetical protein M0P71_13780 [Melioribacteraceae bacterium]|nr:hypothetical protein [Melioribacteraceae bacterium]
MHLVVGTPMYSGMCTSEYVQSLMALKDSVQNGGHKLTSVFLGNESLIQRGRNTIAWHFLNIPDATHLLFADADIKFRPIDVAKMIKADKPIIIGPCPMKGLNWERVRLAAQNGFKGDLSKLSGIFALTELDGHVMKNENEPFQIKHGGTGFMLIRRDVFIDLSKHVGKYINGGTSVSPNAEVIDFFQVGVIDKQLLSEDYFFCDKYRSTGGTVWAAPWCELGHFGSYLFSGCYASGK